MAPTSLLVCECKGTASFRLGQMFCVFLLKKMQSAVQKAMSRLQSLVVAGVARGLGWGAAAVDVGCLEVDAVGLEVDAVGLEAGAGCLEVDSAWLEVDSAWLEVGSACLEVDSAWLEVDAVEVLHLAAGNVALEVALLREDAQPGRLVVVFDEDVAAVLDL